MIRAGTVAASLLSVSCAEPQTLQEMRALIADRERRSVSISGAQQAAANLCQAGLWRATSDPQRGTATTFVLTRDGEVELDQLFERRRAS